MRELKIYLGKSRLEKRDLNKINKVNKIEITLNNSE